MTSKTFTCDPIGIIHTSKEVKFSTPHQPTDGIEERNIVELFPDRRLEVGLRDLEGFERIWLIWWFDRNTNWRPLVTPPRGREKRRGVFATRSPHRPAPIGMTAVPLIEINGRKLIVGNTDLLDQTPILDIKPYISSIDSFPDQKNGWLAEVEAELAKPPEFEVEFSELAETQINWLLDNWDISFMDKTIKILERSPQKSRTHRITNPKDGLARLSSGAWRVFFRVEKQIVRIEYLAPGYPNSLLRKEGFEVIPDWEAQIKFRDIWNL